MNEAVTQSPQVAQDIPDFLKRKEAVTEKKLTQEGVEQLESAPVVKQ